MMVAPPIRHCVCCGGHVIVGEPCASSAMASADLAEPEVQCRSSFEGDGVVVDRAAPGRISHDHKPVLPPGAD